MGIKISEDNLSRQIAGLTSRQREILALIGQGLSTEEIAKRLHRTVKTIESHRSMLGKKLGARNRVELALIAIRSGVADLPETTVASGRDVAPAEHVLRNIDAATCATVGQAFLEALVTQLAIVFDVTCAVVLKLDDKNQLNSIASSCPDGTMPRVSYAITGCPCEHASRAEVRRIDSGLRDRFPQIRAFGTLGVEGILLTPLYDSKEKRLGTLALFHKGHLDRSLHPEIVLRIYAGRAAAELERMDVERSLREMQQRCMLLTEYSGDLISQLTPEGTITYISPACRKLLGVEQDTLLGRSWFDVVDAEDVQLVRQAHASLLHDRDQAVVVHRQRRYDGTIRWFETRLCAHRNAAGRVDWIAGSSQDVTAREVSEAGLVKSKRLLSEAERIANLGCWEWDIRSNYTTWSDETYRIFGYEPQAFAPQCHHFEDRLHPDDAESVIQSIEYSAKTGEPFDCEFRIILPDGSTRVIHERAEANRDEHGQIISLIGIAHDITERKRAEEAVIQSEQRFRDIVRADSDWIWEIDADDVYTYCSESIKDILGYSSDDVVGRTPFDLMAPDDVERVRAEFERFKRKRLPFRDLENWNVRNDGQLVCLLTCGVPVFDESGNFRGYRGVDRDITRRKSTEDALRRSESNLLSAQTVASVGSWHLDVPKNELTWSAETYRIFGLSQDSPLTYERFLSRVHPADRQMVDQAWRAALKGEPYDICHRVLIEGDVRWVRERAVVEFDVNGSPLIAIGTVQDVTERRALEDRAKQTQAMLAHAERLAQFGCWEWDVQNDTARASDHLCRILGVTQETMPRTLTGLLEQLIHPDDREAVKECFRRTVEHGERFESCSRILLHDGEVRRVRAIGEPVRDVSGTITRIVGITTAVTGDGERFLESCS